MDEVGARPRAKDMSEKECIENVVSNGANQINESTVKNRSTSEKRVRNESDEQVVEDADEGFTLVKRKSKKVAVKYSSDSSLSNGARKYNFRRKSEVSEGNIPAIEISLTSNKELPKQIGLARLLKMENIASITQIKYKSAYKAFIKFDNKRDADILLNNAKFVELGYNCRLTNELSHTYGVVKYIELDVKEEELLKDFKSDFEIVSIKRLKRLDERNEWVDSETVRFCFKSATLPQYVYGYDCRFRVESYTFPVTQCSVCWRFGHQAKACPSKNKPICPKCSNEHKNCETTDFKCRNCKGDHVSFSKYCPVFVKEKKIRRIMSMDGCTYKTALSKYLAKQNKAKMTTENVDMYIKYKDNNQFPPLEPIQAAKTNIFSDLNMEEDYCIQNLNNSTESDSSNESIISQHNRKHKQKINKRKTNENVAKTNMRAGTSFVEKVKMQSQNKKLITGTHKQREVTNDITNEKKKQRRGQGENAKENKFIELFIVIKNILGEDSSFEEKLIQVGKVLLKEIMTFIARAVCGGDAAKIILDLFNNVQMQ